MLADNYDDEFTKNETFFGANLSLADEQMCVRTLPEMDKKQFSRSLCSIRSIYRLCVFVIAGVPYISLGMFASLSFSLLFRRTYKLRFYT